ncbi:16S rRNA (guanine(527)-N(7))-methyltransferase RsmG [Roseateles oligotrophus]|uniref:Ribosomal RNA small subunit methyltransferase G n=1 Tax=Roseateles oligotrophus TaxID=1769250 RepID=A0ABT2YM19_9BURK|nr:16S rRNA (guanine(527)-N(7))-methyltransferase RsmG [Roseateles oligotrophus]MCV2371109.1 16S rRNA (guanine(527)-N(7))-methyltransferase RsmG [Roseateles oligotrophus]
MIDISSLRAPLTAAATTLQLQLSEPQVEQLLAYLAMMEKWNKVYNLTSLRDPQAMLTHHLIDSLSLLPALRKHTQGQALRLMDVGSGGGLPGVVIAICNPEIDVSCVDAVLKKASFITQVAAELKLPNLHGVHSRVEALKTPAFDLITSRAFASLLDFTTLTRQHLKPGAIWLAMKGQHPADEIAALTADLDVFHVEQLEVPGLDAQRCLIWIRPKNQAL